jgi:hypothetical protein
MQLGILEKVIAVAIGLYVVAAMMPAALTSLAGANLTGVDPGVVSILQVVLPLLGTIAIAIAFFRE